MPEKPVSPIPRSEGFVAMLLSALALIGMSAGADTYHKFTATVNYGGAEIENMPVLMRLSEGSPVGFHYADVLNDGRDFEITNAQGDALPFEIDTWNTNGESLVWVKVPVFTNGFEFTVAYGRSMADGTASSAQVWSDYVGVWHLGETNDIDAVNGNWGNYPNSTPVVGIDGMKAKRSIADEPGKIGKSVRIANGHDRATFWANSGGKNRCRYGGVFVSDSGDSSPLDLGDTFTISGWFKYDATNLVDSVTGKPLPIFTYYDKLFFKRGTANGTSEGAFGIQMQSQAQGTRDRQEFCIYGSGNDAEAKTGGLGAFTLGEWGHVAFVYSGTSCHFYTNGVRASTETITATLNNNKLLCFGNKTDGFGDGMGENAWNGWIDEVRLQDGARTREEIAAEFAAMSGNALTLGAVEEVSHDTTAPAFGRAPMFEFDMDKDALSFSVDVIGGKGTVLAEYTDVYTGIAVTNVVATLSGNETFPIAAAETPSLQQDHIYSFAAIAVNEAGAHCNRMAGIGTVYFGTLGVACLRNADEAWLHKPESNGVFRISRAAGAASTAEALVVSLALTGQGIALGAARRVEAGTTATIPAGESSVDVAIVPVYNTEVTTAQDVTLTVHNMNVNRPLSSTATMSVASTDENLLERYVAENGSDDNLGVSPGAPMRSPVAAVNAIKQASMSRASTVHVAPGLYPVAESMELTAPIRVLGEGASPTDVVITNTVWASTSGGKRIDRIAALDNPSAMVTGVTMAGAGASENNAPGFCFIVNANGGMVSNCVVQSCGARGSAYSAAWLYGANSHVSHTVFRDITPGRQPEGHWEVNRPVCVALQNGAVAENCLFTDIFTDKTFNVVTLDSSSSMRNCTIVRCTLGETLPDFCYNYDNTKLLTAYAMPVYCDSANSLLVNCAFVGVCNANGAALPPVGITNSAGKALLKMSCCLMDAMPANITAGSLAAAGNVVVDPANLASLFKNYARGDWTKGDYCPKVSGPLANAGTNYVDMAGVDLAGKPRTVGSGVDIGCYESSKLLFQIMLR